MSIWKTPLSIDQVNERGRGTLSDFLGIRYVQVEESRLIAEMRVEAHHLQPGGVMNGGVSCAFAESVASAASNYCCASNEYCVGIDLNTNHIAPAASGDVLQGIAKPLHIGKSTQVWAIEIFNQHARLISISRLTLLTKKKL